MSNNKNNAAVIATIEAARSYNAKKIQRAAELIAQQAEGGEFVNFSEEMLYNTVSMNIQSCVLNAWKSLSFNCGESGWEKLVDFVNQQTQSALSTVIGSRSTSPVENEQNRIKLCYWNEIQQLVRSGW